MWYVVVLGLAMFTGCAPVAALLDGGEASVVVPGVTPDAGPDAGRLRPVARREVVSMPASAGTPRRLGTTVAALGDPSRPGAWIETPLVNAEKSGQVRHGDLGLAVTLIPAGGPATGGSRLSLTAMRELKLPLTELTEVEVYSGG